MSDSVLLTGNLTLLNRALADVKARVGQFLVNEKILLDMAPRLSSLVDNTTGSTREVAKVLSGKQAALMQNQKTLEKEAFDFIGSASDFKTRIDTDPVYSFLKTPMKAWGIRQGQILAKLASDSSRFVGPAAGLTARLLAQNKDVTALAAEVRQTENAAAGTGTLPKISRLISGTVGTTASAILAPLKGALWPLALGLGAVAVIWATKPGILKSR